MAWEGSSAARAELLSFLNADIRGYTAFTQVRGDEAAAELAGKFAAVAREGIEAYDGRLLELRGDEALAVFTSARASLRAAVALQEVFADETRLDPGLPLTVGIGLDAGEVVGVSASVDPSATGAPKSRSGSNSRATIHRHPAEARLNTGREGR